MYYVNFQKGKPAVGLYRFNGDFYECLVNQTNLLTLPVCKEDVVNISKAFDEAIANTTKDFCIYERFEYISESKVVNDTLAHTQQLVVLSNPTQRNGAGVCKNESAIQSIGRSWGVSSVCVIPFSKDAVLLAPYASSEGCEILEWATDILRDVAKEGILEPLTEDCVFVYEVA